MRLNYTNMTAIYMDVHYYRTASNFTSLKAPMSYRDSSSLITLQFCNTADMPFHPKNIEMNIKIYSQQSIKHCCCTDFTQMKENTPLITHIFYPNTRIQFQDESEPVRQTRCRLEVLPHVNSVAVKS